MLKSTGIVFNLEAYADIVQTAIYRAEVGANVLHT